MHSNIERIVPLPPDVAAQIKSSTAIPTLNSVVVGLIKNALDAGSSRVDIEVNFGRGSCVVEDDGYGIAPVDFGEAGGLGKSCYTSKHGSFHCVHGINGSFLAAVAALSILTVTSHHHAYRSLSTLILHHSRPAARLIPAPHHQQLSNRKHGTKVTVQDLFGSMPVRVKQRALRFAEAEKDGEKEMESLKKQIVELLLAWHRPVLVVLAGGGTKSRRLVIGKGADTTISGKGTSHTAPCLQPDVTMPISKLDAKLICTLLSQAGYIEPTDWPSWIKTMARTSTITVRGAMSTTPASSKDVQFVSLGIRPISSETSGNLIHEEINKAFATSSFGNTEEYTELEEDKRIKDRRFKQNGFTNKQLRGRGKGIDRWPMFYVRIDFQEKNEIERLESGSVLSSVISIIKAMVIGFLKDNHFRPRASVKPRREHQLSTPGSLRASEKPDTFSTWSRIKSSRAFTGTAKSFDKDKAGRAPNAGHQTEPPPPFKTASQLPIDTAELTSAHDDSASAITTGGEEVIEWINPVSKLKVLVNARTGLVVTKKPVERRPYSAPAILQNPSSMPANRLTRRFTMPPRTPTPGSWAGDFLARWENPVFALAEQPIPQAADFESPGILHGHDHHCSHFDIQDALTKASTTFSAKLSKPGLSRARIIAQVDKKFILISLPSGDSQTLVLVDQHAADERIRVEALIDELHTAPSLQLPKPLVLDLPIREHLLLEKHTTYFARWGITYSASPNQFPSANGIRDTNDKPPPAQKPARLEILTLPPSIAQRCLLDPPTLLTLLRTTLHDMPSSTSLTIPPPALRNLLNSRACRSAIMFNDVLTLAEAEVLVRRLAETKLPFQCAHGRPSMVPIGEVAIRTRTGVGPSEGEVLGKGWGSDEGDEEGGFVRRWQRWRAMEEEGKGDGAENNG